MVYTGKESAVMVFSERIVPSLVAVVVLFIGHASCVQDQAPGDGVAICTEETINGMPNHFFTNRPMYSANERPLMDSRDYNRLLQESGDAYVPWQSLDRDNNNSIGVRTEWSQTGTATCQGTVTACGFSEGAQENWLITQHINTVLPGGGGERLRKVTVQFEGTLNGCDITIQCRKSFELYKWETPAIDRNGATNTNNYVRVGRVSPAGTSGDMPFVDSHDIELGTTGGVYLGVVDLTTCVTLTRILVLYYVCPENTSELISRPEAIESLSLEGSPSVEGECVENSSTESGANPILICGAKGQWNVIKHCLCNPGYQLDSSQDNCSECPEGNFSSGLGNGPCETCPANSEGTGTALSLCPCHQDYYRAPYEGPSVPCTQSPGPPSDVRVSNVTNTSAVLSWSPPDNGGGRPLYEIVYTVTATDRGGSGGERVVVSEVNDTETNVTGLTPGVLYTFSVSAENDVSSQDNNINARSLSTTNTTEEGVGGTVTEFVVGENGVLSWSPPVPLNGDIRYYNVIISTADSGQLVTRVEEVDVLTIDVSKYGEINMDYNVTVQAVTSVGGGDFSSPVTVSLREPPPDSKSDPPVTVIAVTVIVVVIVLLAIIVTCLGAYICWYRTHVRHKSLFGIELPNKGLRKYVDPSTYQRVDEAVGDFAKEIGPKSINLTEEIGNGEFGNVYRGIWKVDRKEQLMIAVKTLKPGSSLKLRNDFLTEASIMGQFDHQNVIKLYGVVTKVEPVMIVMEYMQNGSLYYYLKKKDEQMSSTQLVRMALGVARGMEYLSDVGFVHRDLAARNVLVDRDEVTKVADFGLSRETVEDVYEVTKGGKIPVRWTAPEAIAYRKFTISSDVWSFGVLLWEVMSYCQQPYDGWDNQTVLSKLDNGHRLHKPKDCPDTVYKCMLECWNAEARKRPTFGQVVRILEILLEGNIAEGPKPKPRAGAKPASTRSREVVSPLEYQSVEEWLASIKMQKYTDNFLESDHTTVTSCLELTADDLTKMGITLAGHQNKIISSIRIGRDQFQRQESIRV